MPDQCTDGTQLLSTAHRTRQQCGVDSLLLTSVSWSKPAQREMPPDSLRRLLRPAPEDEHGVGQHQGVDVQVGAVEHLRLGGGSRVG